jgi:hypothetical protein
MQWCYGLMVTKAGAVMNGTRTHPMTDAVKSFKAVRRLNWRRNDASLRASLRHANALSQ